eukprot:55103-Eustigmatos_ZCMA.PRE.2
MNIQDRLALDQDPVKYIEDLAKAKIQEMTEAREAAKKVEQDRITMSSQSYQTELEQLSSDTKAVEKELADLDSLMKRVDNAVQFAQGEGILEKEVVVMCEFKQWAETKKKLKQAKLIEMKRQHKDLLEHGVEGYIRKREYLEELKEWVFDWSTSEDERKQRIIFIKEFVKSKRQRSS